MIIRPLHTLLVIFVLQMPAGCGAPLVDGSRGLDQATGHVHISERGMASKHTEADADADALQASGSADDVSAVELQSHAQYQSGGPGQADDGDRVGEPMSALLPLQVGPEIHPRHAWTASPVSANNATAMGEIYRMTIHHTGGDHHAELSGGELLARIEHGHVANRGWAAVGYHFVIAGDGSIWRAVR